MESIETVVDEYVEYPDYTEIIQELSTIQENQIQINNNFVDSIEILIIFIGLFIGLVLGSLFVKVIFHGT